MQDWECSLVNMGIRAFFCKYSLVHSFWGIRALHHDVHPGVPHAGSQQGPHMNFVEQQHRPRTNGIVWDAHQRSPKNDTHMDG